MEQQAEWRVGGRVFQRDGEEHICDAHEDNQQVKLIYKELAEALRLPRRLLAAAEVVADDGAEGLFKAFGHLNEHVIEKQLDADSWQQLGGGDLLGPQEEAEECTSVDDVYENGRPRVLPEAR